jgi:hypothetical protein
MFNRTKEMGEWRIFETADAVAEHVAEWLCALACECDRDFAVCLSGGSTPRHLYRQLTRKPFAARFPWKHAHWFWGDERFVPHDSLDSNYRMAYDALFSHVPVRLDIRWTAGEAALERKFVTELVGLTPDVILATASPTVAALQNVTRTVPTVFAHAVDPVGAGFVDSLARPGGNATGFVLFEYGMGVKWLELLKEIAPNVTRVAVLRDPAIAAGIGQFGAIQSVAPTLVAWSSPPLTCATLARSSARYQHLPAPLTVASS